MPTIPWRTPPTRPPATPPLIPFDHELAVCPRYFYTTDDRPCPCWFRLHAGTVRVGGGPGVLADPQFSCVGAKIAVAPTRPGWACTTCGLRRATRRRLPAPVAFLADPARRAGRHRFVTSSRFSRRPTDWTGRFEGRLWEQLRRLNRLDAPHHAYDPAVTPDADDPHFGFSFAGTAFFVVGLHPHSSREARRFPWPLLVFNPHAQFTRLREAGRWARMQDVIRTREMSLQGSLNPNLAEHGNETEARQYSGRSVEPDWQPPFEAEPPGPAAGGCPFAHRRAQDKP